jgi:hypothetical protein
MKCYKLFFGKYLSMRSSIVTFVNNLLLLLKKTTKYTMSESDSQVNAHVREIDQKLSLMERELAVKQQIILLFQNPPNKEDLETQFREATTDLNELISKRDTLMESGNAITRDHFLRAGGVGQ